MRLSSPFHGLRFVAVAALSTTAGCAAYGMPIGRRAPPSCATVCAFGVPGVRTCVEDTRDGIDVTFVVVGDATLLRQRAHAALSGTYPLRPESRELARRVNVTIRDEPDGLVLHAVPIRSSELESVRQAVRALIAGDQSSPCE